MSARQLLDLIDLFEDPTALAIALRSAPCNYVEELFDTVAPASDLTTRRAARSLLERLGAIDGTGDIQNLGAKLIADALELVLDTRAELTARQLPPTSALVVTATTSPELAALRAALHLRPLFQLVEDVIRATEARCILGAPYWNAAALERLRPSLVGLARRGGEIDFVCQGAEFDDTYNPVGVLTRFCSDLSGEGAREAQVWAFDTRDDSGRRALIHAKFALADRRLGYLGSANMTGQGFAEHFEIGVRLTPIEAADLVSLIDRLRAAGFLVRPD